jgi:hypothetical protein
MDGGTATDVEKEALPRKASQLFQFVHQLIRMVMLEDVVRDHQIVTRVQRGWVGEGIDRRVVTIHRRLDRGAQGVDEFALPAAEIEDAPATEGPDETREAYDRRETGSVAGEALVEETVLGDQIETS